MDARIREIGSQQGGPRGRTDAYFDMPGVQALGRDATDEQIAGALQDAQLGWFAAEGHYGESKTEEEKMERAELYSQEEYRDDAEFAMKVGKSPLDFEAIKNTAKEAGEKGRKDEVERQTEAHKNYGREWAGPPEFDIFGKIKQQEEVWDLEAYLDFNEDLTQKAEDEAVISSMLGQEGIENFIRTFYGITSNSLGHG